MNVPRSVADVLNDHVVFEVECIDRMYCNVYIPGLQYAAGLVGYVHQQLGLPIASTAPLAEISDRFSAGVHRFARDYCVPWVDFVKGQRKDDMMQEYLAGFTGAQGVVFIGRAQEKTTVFRTEKRRNSEGRTYPWIVKSTGMVNHYYFYCVDEDFGPLFIKFCSYFTGPRSAWTSRSIRSWAFSLRSRFSSAMSSTEKAASALPFGTILGIPVGQRALVDSEITSDLSDRFPGLPDDPHSPLTKLLVELPAFL